MDDSERFPYRDPDGSARGKINEVIIGVIPMIRDLIYSSNRYNLPSHVLEEIYSTCLEKIWMKFIQQYDASRGVKISTYLRACCYNCIIEELRSYSRMSRSKKRIDSLPPESMSGIGASDEKLDKKIESIAKDILDNPSSIFTPHMVLVLKTKLDNPGLSMKELATLLGYKRPSSLSMMLGRMRSIVSDISIEDLGEASKADPFEAA